MKWLRKLLGTDFPDPQVGQIWRSENSGWCIRVSSVETTDRGTVRVSVQYEVHGVWKTVISGRWVDIATDYAYGLDQWRSNLRNERRVLVGTEREA